MAERAGFGLVRDDGRARAATGVEPGF